ncbi:hypothetical protein JTE90_001535 [Oedothorax gibbosus]|uniref:Uncharacterized protein n=1 Tax=Oedothorax gibbosus TaxID=931172 RepID=A0AAV6TPS2_9ARAC|nr:hypothetical protein JTE90_001535 [Oedothorax gibbosus]
MVDRKTFVCVPSMFHPTSKGETAGICFNVGITILASTSEEKGALMSVCRSLSDADYSSSNRCWCLSAMVDRNSFVCFPSMFHPTSKGETAGYLFQCRHHCILASTSEEKGALMSVCRSLSDADLCILKPMLMFIINDGQSEHFVCFPFMFHPTSNGAGICFNVGVFFCGLIALKSVFFCFFQR